MPSLPPKEIPVTLGATNMKTFQLYRVTCDEGMFAPGLWSSHCDGQNYEEPVACNTFIERNDILVVLEWGIYSNISCTKVCVAREGGPTGWIWGFYPFITLVPCSEDDKEETCPQQ